MTRLEREAHPILESPRSPGRDGVLGGLFNVLIALGAFGAVAAGIGSQAPWPEEHGLSEKMAYFRAHKDEIDAVYVGSSRVFRSFAPRLIDAEYAERGTPIRSFNFGVPGMLSFETDHVIRTVLELEPAKLKWIFLEAGDWDPEFPVEWHAYAYRTVHWHTPRQTLNALESVRRRDYPWWKAIPIAFTHVRLFAWKYANHGVGRRIVAHRLGLEEEFLDREVLEVERGYQPLDDLQAERYLERRRRFLDPEEQALYLDRVARIEAGSLHRVDLSRYNLGALAEQIAAIEGSGVLPVYVVLVANGPQPGPLTLMSEGHLPRLLDFNRPAAFPFLFEVEKRFDSNHLNRAGAVLFSEVLVDRFPAIGNPSDSGR